MRNFPLAFPFQTHHRAALHRSVCRLCLFLRIFRCSLLKLDIGNFRLQRPLIEASLGPHEILAASKRPLPKVTRPSKIFNVRMACNPISCRFQMLLAPMGAAGEQNGRQCKFEDFVGQEDRF